MTTNNGYILALDVGEKRIGAALASPVAKLPRPHSFISNDTNVWKNIEQLIADEEVSTVVIGLPRSLESNDTAQTRWVRDFASELEEKMGVTVAFQDEALTSRKAEAELRANGKHFSKGDIDALAATYILEDYLAGAGTIDTMRGDNE